MFFAVLTLAIYNLNCFGEFLGRGNHLKTKNKHGSGIWVLVFKSPLHLIFTSLAYLSCQVVHKKVV
jgi:hypothetical protein